MACGRCSSEAGRRWEAGNRQEVTLDAIEATGRRRPRGRDGARRAAPRSSQAQQRSPTRARNSTVATGRRERGMIRPIWIESAAIQLVPGATIRIDGVSRLASAPARTRAARDPMAVSRPEHVDAIARAPKRAVGRNPPARRTALRAARRTAGRLPPQGLATLPSDLRATVLPPDGKARKRRLSGSPSGARAHRAARLRLPGSTRTPQSDVRTMRSHTTGVMPRRAGRAHEATPASSPVSAHIADLRKLTFASAVVVRLTSRRRQAARSHDLQRHATSDRVPDQHRYWRRSRSAPVRDRNAARRASSRQRQDAPSNANNLAHTHDRMNGRPAPSGLGLTRARRHPAAVLPGDQTARGGGDAPARRWCCGSGQADHRIHHRRTTRGRRDDGNEHQRLSMRPGR